MRRIFAVLAALGLMLVLGASQALAADGAEPESHQRAAPRDQRPARPPAAQHAREPSRSAAATPCSTPAACRQAGRRRSSRPGASRTSRRTSSRCAPPTRNTITVGAGDLIGASPLVSALFHDEPTIEALNSIGLDVGAVSATTSSTKALHELLRMQNGGCHPVDGCQDGDGVRGAVFQYLAANVFYAGTDQTHPAAVRGEDGRRQEDRLHRADARGRRRRSSRRRRSPGLDFRPEVATVNALVTELRRSRTSRRSSCSCTRAARSRLRRRSSQARPTSPTRTSTSTGARTSTARRSPPSRPGSTTASR